MVLSADNMMLSADFFFFLKTSLILNSLVVLLLLPGAAVFQNAGCHYGVSSTTKIISGVNAKPHIF
jgi:hypothetical protein